MFAICYMAYIRTYVKALYTVCRSGLNCCLSIYMHDRNIAMRVIQLANPSLALQSDNKLKRTNTSVLAFLSECHVAPILLPYVEAALPPLKRSDRRC